MAPSLLSGSVWLSLPQTTRAKIAELFGLSKSGNVTVFNGPNGSEVRSDGYTYEDLSVITVESMQEKLGSKKEDFYSLFKDVCFLVNENSVVTFFEDKMNFGKEILEIIEIVDNKITTVAIEEEKIEGIIEDSVVIDEVGTIPTKSQFCGSCTSKGGRHMKNCPKASKYEKGTA
jgi:hypothetical protein